MFFFRFLLQSIGGLLNATFGNAVELIVAIIALSKGEIRVVQASILGAIISNLLLILGICFFAKGIYYEGSKFNRTAAQASLSLMALANIGLIIPAAFISSFNGVEKYKGNLLKLSRGTAIILLIIYILHLIFQVSTTNLCTEFYSSPHVKCNFLGLLLVENSYACIS